MVVETAVVACPIEAVAPAGQQSAAPAFVLDTCDCSSSEAVFVRTPVEVVVTAVAADEAAETLGSGSQRVAGVVDHLPMGFYVGRPAVGVQANCFEQ